MNRNKLLTYILVISLMIVYANYFSGYFGTAKEQSRLTSQISDKMSLIRSLGTTDPDLEQKLTATLETNQEAKSVISNQEINTTAIINDLLQTADKNNITATPIYADEWTQTTVLGTTYYMLPIEVSLEGNLSEIMDFIQNIEISESFANITIEMLSIVVPASDVTTVNGSVTADLNISIIYRVPSQGPLEGAE